VKNDNPLEECNYKILLVDDQSFNIDALVVILKYSVGVDSKKYCDRALSGEQALQMV
jgi:CheY-like chemotaxis protein